MKYIRTKGGNIVDTQDMHPETLKWYQDFHLLKQADNIEELVDEYVCVMPSGETFLLDKNTDLKAQVNYVGDVYGEIWVDGELHKVAKANDNGKLELL